jgi:hypothetical protein
MKTKSWLFLVIMLFNCQHQETPIDQPFTADKAAGLWVLYEMKTFDGIVTEAGGVQLADIFAPYTGSVKLNSDGTYIPMMWFSNTDIGFNDTYSGTFNIVGDKLFFDSPAGWQTELKLIKFTGEELWVKGENEEYKLRKEQGNSGY